MKEPTIIHDSISNTWSIIVKKVNMNLFQVEYPEMTGFITQEEAYRAYNREMNQFAKDMEYM